MIYQDIPLFNPHCYGVNQCFRLSVDDEIRNRKHLFMPDGLLSVIYIAEGGFTLNRSAEYRSKQVLVASFSKPQSVSFHDHTVVYGQTFYPWVVKRLGIPLKEMKDVFLPLGDLFPEKHQGLMERLDSCLRDNEVFDTIWKSVFEDATFPLSPSCQEALVKVIKNKGLIQVADCIGGLTLSERRLQQEFKDLMGMTLKNYIDLCRFNYSKKLVEQSPRLSLVTVALSAGYYDQSHFIRHFKRFTGRTPNQIRNTDVGMGSYFGLYEKC